MKLLVYVQKTRSALKAQKNKASRQGAAVITRDGELSASHVSSTALTTEDSPFAIAWEDKTEAAIHGRRSVPSTNH